MNLTKDIRCQKCRKLLAKTSANSKLIVTSGTQYYQGINCIEIVCKRCKEKNYIALQEEEINDN